MKPKTAKAIDPADIPTTGLLGLFGHSIDDTGDLRWQFHIVRALADGKYGCQMFGWLMGEPIEIMVLSEAELTDPKRYRLYGSKEEWHQAAERNQIRRDRHEGR
jgi:hypothetical protein